VLRAKVSERERFHIDSIYFMTVTGELEKAVQNNELWRQTYPRDAAPYRELAFLYGSLGDLERSLEEAQEAVRVEQSSSNNYLDLGIYYAALNRLDEAEAAYKQEEDLKLGNAFLLQWRYQLAFLKGDGAQMARMSAAAMGRPGTEDLLLAAQADTEAWYGKLKKARDLTQRAMGSAQHDDAQETAAAYEAAASLREAGSGNRDLARVAAASALKLAPNRDVRAMAALVLARAGDTAAAEKLAAVLDQTLPLDTLVQRYWLPTIRAAVAIERKDPARALELLKVASTIELGQPTALSVFLCPVYLRGEAYLMMHDGKAAAAEFQKFSDHRGLVGNFQWGALARLGLARAYVMQRDAVKGKAAYQDFLTLWKDADLEVPILKQAKAEFAQLK
jgi:tetratricopeptide (TPR) repeat protein